MLGLLLIAEAASAALPARSFFRRSDSLFPSGQAHPGELEKRRVRDFHEISFLIQKDNLSLKVPTNVLIRDMDLSLKLAHSKTGATGLVIGTRGPWAYVVSGPKNQRSWWSLNDGLPIPDDKGLAIPLLKTLLRREPKWKTEMLREIEPGTRLRLIGFQGDWVEVSKLTEPNVRGWVDINSVILKHDFASFVLPTGGKWTPVRYRQGAFMVAASGEKIRVDEVQSLMTRPDLGILTQDLTEHGLYQRSFVSIKNWESIKWVVSTLSGHGEVYWKDDGSEKETKSAISTPIVSFDEILKKPIFSVAFHPLNPRIGVISAEGIYLTTDGLNWRKVPQFENDNLPVAISADHEIFAGHLRSTDQGKSFLPFLKWEQIAELMDSRHGKASRIMRLVKILPLAQRKVEIEIDNGVKISRLVGSTKFGLVTHWKTEARSTPQSSAITAKP